MCQGISQTPTQQLVYLGVFLSSLFASLAEGFQSRRLKCEKLTDDRCQVMAKAHIAFGKVS
jgi:hypothetical protein